MLGPADADAAPAVDAREAAAAAAAAGKHCIAVAVGSGLDNTQETALYCVLIHDSVQRSMEPPRTPTCYMHEVLIRKYLMIDLPGDLPNCVVDSS